MSRNLRLFHKLLSELKKSNQTGMKLQDTDIYKVVMSNYRQHKLTAEQLFRDSKELENLVSAYSTYLESVRRHNELIKQWGGRERTTKEAANLVGLELPKIKNEISSTGDLPESKN